MSVEGYTEVLYYLEPPEWNVGWDEIWRGDVFSCGEYDILAFLWIGFDATSQEKSIETIKMRLKDVFEDVGIAGGCCTGCIVDTEAFDDFVVCRFGYKVDI